MTKENSKIVLEGSDGSGKSTVAEKLTVALPNYTYVHGSSFENAKTDNNTLYTGFIDLAMQDKLILDRFWMSNRVYANIYKGYARVDHNQVATLKALSGTTLFVYFFASRGELIKRMTERGEDYIEPSKVGEILQEYGKELAALEDSGARVLYLNTEVLSSDQCVQIILDNYQVGKLGTAKGVHND